MLGCCLWRLWFLEQIYLLQQSRGIHVKSTPSLDHMSCAVFALTFTDDVAVHKNGDEGTGWKSSLVGLWEDMQAHDM